MKQNSTENIILSHLGAKILSQNVAFLAGKEATTYGYFPHWLQMGLPASIVPKFIIDRISLNMLSATRKRALKKMEQKKSE